MIGDYKRVFKVTQAQISQFKNLSFPANVAQVDSAILYWPGAQNPSVLSDYGVNISSQLAPFVDVNHNGIYDPLQGDYPGIIGDEGIFFVFNDARKPHTETNGFPLGVEIRGIATSFTDSTTPLPYEKRAVNNAIFVQYEVENKSDTNYTGFDFAMWLDPDLGCFNNDYVGCDTTRDLMMCYNGTSPDPNCSPELGYGSINAALGVKYLNHPMNVFGYFTNMGGAATGDPISAMQYRNYSEGLWVDNSPFTWDSIGYYSEPPTPTTFIFPGDPNDSTQWSEIHLQDRGSPINNPGDRRMFSSTRNLNFNIGETKCFDFAFFTSLDTSSNTDMFKIVDTLKRDADIIQAFYNTHFTPCQGQFTLAVPEIKARPLNVSIFPNPTSNQITIEASDNIQTLQLMDVTGRVLIDKTVGSSRVVLSVSNLAKGVYMLSVMSNGNNVVRKVVVE